MMNGEYSLVYRACTMWDPSDLTYREKHIKEMYGPSMVFHSSEGPNEYGAYTATWTNSNYTDEEIFGDD